MEINGLSIRASFPGKLKNWAIDYLARARAFYPQLRKLPVPTINRFGTILLTLNPFYSSWLAVADIPLKNNRDITLNYNKDIVLKIQKVVLAGRTDFVLVAQDGSGCLKRLAILYKDVPVIASYLPADVARIAKETGRTLPGRPFVAITREGNNVVRIESLDDQRILYVHMNLIGQPEIPEGEFNDIIQKNAEKLKEILALHKFKQFEKLVVLKVSTRGEILWRSEEKAEEEGYFDFGFIVSPDRPLELIPQNMIVMLGNIVRVVQEGSEEIKIPSIIWKLMLNSAYACNILSKGRQN